jgi:hypothetical protein
MTRLVGLLILIAGIWLWRKGMEYERRGRR